MLVFEDSVNIVKYILLKLFWLKFFRCKNIEFKFVNYLCGLGKSLIL